MKSVSQWLVQRTMIYGGIQARQRRAKPVYPFKLHATLNPIVIILHEVSMRYIVVPHIARVAQLVEQRTENPRVGGSNPPPGTTFS